MYTIENDQLKIKIDALGAELNSVINKANGLEYMWSGDVNFWGKKSPVLFPIVGTLKDNVYKYNEQSYELGRHGFARTMIFNVTDEGPESISFTIRSNENTAKVFPFYFIFCVTYTLQQDRLFVKYTITNKGAGMMYFSVGGHPAFKLPVKDGLSYDDYYLLFNQMENAGRWMISDQGLIEKTSSPLLENTNRLPLTKELFYRDAIVLKHLASDEVQLRSGKDSAGLSFSFKGFPYLGIWAAKNADFICIEPWCGIADSVDANQDIKDKEGIVELAPDEVFSREWSVRIF